MKNMNDLCKFMQIAIDEAKASLREGNDGYGAVIIKNNEIISKAHDCGKIDKDTESHVEVIAIKTASQIIGKNLNGCILLSTHKPSPDCASEILKSGIDHVAYGFSINESHWQGKDQSDMKFEEIFQKSGNPINIDKNILADQCSLLYHRDVRNEINRLRNATTEKLNHYNEDSINRRIKWFKENRNAFTFINDNLLDSAYNLLLCRFKIDAAEAPIVHRSDAGIIFHSKNFCPTLEACKILSYDTRYICKNYNENSTDILIKQIDSRLHFSRNYDKLRPYADYCEEMISFEK